MITPNYSDNVWAVIPVSDWVKLPKGIGRSKTFKDPQECWQKGAFDKAITHSPGTASIASFVKVPMQIIEAFNAQKTVLPPTKGGKGKVIADYPHKCHACGGRMLQLFTSTEHEGGICPATISAKR